MSAKVNGFTLIELLIVIAIIGILAGLVIASVGTVRLRARDADRLNTFRQIQNALELYYADNGQYPEPTSGLGYDATWLQGWQCPFLNLAGTNWQCLQDIIGQHITLPEDINKNRVWYGVTDNGRGYVLGITVEQQSIGNSDGNEAPLCDDDWSSGTVDYVYCLQM